VGTLADETWGRLSAVAHLLHHAATKVWQLADQQAPDVALQSFGLAVYLARAQVIELVPLGHRLPEDSAVHLDLAGQTVLQLLAAAEKQTRTLPTYRPDLAGCRQLVVDLCDLVREARDLGL
jgi:hypothetical protein